MLPELIIRIGFPVTMDTEGTMDTKTNAGLKRPAFVICPDLLEVAIYCFTGTSRLMVITLPTEPPGLPTE
jgi:hypothetical protein